MAGKEPVADKAAAAREAAAELKAKQKAKTRRTALLGAIGALAVVGIVVAAIVLTSKDGGEAIKAPTFADDSGGILVGPEGVAGVEGPEDAVRVDLYEDPICPFCMAFMVLASGELGSLVDEGEVELYYHPIAFLDEASSGTLYSTRAANAMSTVAEYDPEHFWVFVEVLFQNQPAEGSEGLSDTQIEELAEAAGVSEEAISKFEDGEFTAWVASETARVLGDDVIGGTPAFFIGGVQFNGWAAMNEEGQLVPAPGNITAAVEYVKENGADALADLLNSDG